MSKNKTKTIKQFIKEAIAIFGNKYDYSKTIYKKSHKKVCIICHKHGKFKVTPNNHIVCRQGCPRCSSSKGEKLIEEYLVKYKIKYTPNKKFIGCKNKKQLRFDFYLPEYNLCIEFDGMQHFIPFGFGSEDKNEKFKRTKINDEIKNNFCIRNSIPLLRIPYTKIKGIKKVLDNTFQIFKKI